MSRSRSTASTGPGIVVALWIVALDDGDGTALGRGAEWLDATERAAVDAKLVPRDRRWAEASRVALRAILGARLGVGPGAVALDRDACPLCGDPHGRPVLAGVADRVRLPFSLSRAGAFAAIAVVEGAPAVGVDLECLPPRVGAEDLLAALAPDEARSVAALPRAERDLAALRCWTRKEAVLKGWGTGLGVDPASVPVGLGPGPGGAGAFGPGVVAPVHLAEHGLRRSGWAVADVGVTAPVVVAVAAGSNEPTDAAGAGAPAPEPASWTIEVHEVALGELLGSGAAAPLIGPPPGRRG